ncbi:hypothetical protein [Candidatus Nitronereus thalassa]|uniref:Lipoprotein n=1 Tax=Candidatus Nitronereus thalassa TaxID=3020898 RepID=A0ABU3KAA5_9BACT|nr:hypothetical protein [Candidatus Nitronereus thalassa]MDT7043361.1 hypothetical protein [Candidatus Nitronereus thalassa]
MKRVTVFLAVGILGLGLLLAGCTSSGIAPHGTFGNTETQYPADFHMAALQQHQSTAEMLEEKIKKLENRIKDYDQKPYRDPKGYRRDGWARLIETWKQEVKGLREKIVWHNSELARLQASTFGHGLTGEKKVGNS